MNRRSTCITAAALLLALSVARGEEGGAALRLPPVESAMCMLDTLPLLEAEGIWEYASEEVTVLVRRASAVGRVRLVMTVLEAFDTRLAPGDTLGWLEPTEDPRRFTLSQYTRMRRGLLDKPGRCKASLTADGFGMKVSAPGKISIRINPFTLLPRFWRLVSVSSAQVNASDERQEGLRKVYPSPDGPGVRMKRKRWL